METEAFLSSNLQSQPQRPVQLVLVRANGPLFYSVAAASLLEAATSNSAARLLEAFPGEHELCDWMTTVWLPGKAARAAQLRDYVEAMWPEFDWAGAQEQHRALEDGGTRVGPQQPTAAHAALARCVASAQSGIFYRCIARWAEDPRLRQMARVIAQEEALSSSRFRAVYERHTRTQRFGFTTAWRTAHACVRAARDTQLAMVFNAITAHCSARVPFPVLEYYEFVVRMRSVVERHGELGTPERILFRPWIGRPRVRVEAKETRIRGWFRPVLLAAA